MIQDEVILATLQKQSTRIAGLILKLDLANSQIEQLQQTIKNQVALLAENEDEQPIEPEQASE